MHKRWAGRLKMWEIFTICTPGAELRRKHQCKSEDITLYLCTFSRTALNWWRQVATCVFICWDKFIYSLHTEVGKRDKNMENESNSEGVVCIVEHNDVLIVVIISVHWIVYLISLDFKLKIQGDSDATVVLEGLWAPSRHHVNKMKTPLVSLSIASACWLWGISVEAIPPIRTASMLAGWWVSLNCMLYLLLHFWKHAPF